MDSSDSQKWYYGSSWVQFDYYNSMKVKAWDNSGGNLNLAHSGGAVGSTFTLGSTQAGVLAAQGNPTSMSSSTSQKFHYGSSWVQFDYYNEKVKAWDNSGGNLNLQ